MDLLEENFGEVHLSTIVSLPQLSNALDLDPSDTIVIREDIHVFAPEEDIKLWDGLHVYFRREEELTPEDLEALEIANKHLSGAMEEVPPDVERETVQRAEFHECISRYYLGEDKDPPNRKCFPGHFKDIDGAIVSYMDKCDRGKYVAINVERGPAHQCFMIDSSHWDIPEGPYLWLRQAMKAVENTIGYTRKDNGKEGVNEEET
jgi:hypothetical protein